MNENQQHIEDEEEVIRTGINAGDDDGGHLGSGVGFAPPNGGLIGSGT
jgi:hypothetical protein